MRKPNPPKEIPPSLGGVGGHGVSPVPALAEQFSKQWREFRTHGELGQSVFLSFSAKPYDSPNNIYLGRYVHVSFTESTTLLPAYKIASQHPAWLIIKCDQDSGVFRVSNAWLWDRSSPANPQLMTRVMGGKVIVYGFLHDKTQKFYLQEGSVFPRHINAFLRLLSPAYKGTYMLSSECAGYVDAILAEERAHVTPRSLVTFQRILLGCVALLQKLRHPNIPSLVVAACVALGGGEFPAQIACFPRVKCKSSFQSSAFTPALAGNVQETNPPVGGVAPLI